MVSSHNGAKPERISLPVVREEDTKNDWGMIENDDGDTVDF